MARTSVNSVAVEDGIRARGIPLRRLDWLRVRGGALMWFEARSPYTTAAAIRTCRDKQATRERLQAAGVPTPDGVRVPAQAAAQAAHRLGWPVTVKPADGSRGRAVTTRIAEDALLGWAVAAASGDGRDDVVVEQSIDGVHWRLLVAATGRTVSALECRPWRPVGDGRSTIAELLAAENRRREAIPSAWRLQPDAAPLRRILDLQRLALSSVLAAGQTCEVAWSYNARQGALNCERLPAAADTHPHVLAAGEAALRALPGLHHTAVDLVDDGTVAWVVDVNSNPGLGTHIRPVEGDPRPVVAELLAPHYP